MRSIIASNVAQMKIKDDAQNVKINIFCNNCKADYYYELSKGIFASCSYSFDNCLKCSYLKES